MLQWMTGVWNLILEDLRMIKKREYKTYKKFDVVYADFGMNPNGVEGGMRPAVIVSIDASNHKHAPQIQVVPLSTKLKDIPVHVRITPQDINGYRLKATSDFLPENLQTLPKKCVRGKNGYIPKESGVREAIDRALIKQFDLLPIARKMILEEANMQNSH